MSKRETPMTRWYWQQIGRTLVEEFRVVKRSKTVGQRLVDGIILPNQPNRIAHWRDVTLDGEDVIVVQTKNARLGMYLMGQTVFSAELVRRRFNPRTVRSVALVRRDDEVMHALLDGYPDVEVVVAPPSVTGG